MINRRRTITPEEEEMFEAVLRGEKVLDRQPPASRPTTRPGPKQQAKTATETRRAPSGIDGRTAERLRKGALEPDAKLDLHGLTEDSAHRALVTFLRGALSRGARLALVVTGKGLKPSAPDEPFDLELDRRTRGVLRAMVPRWLEEPDLAGFVADVRSAHRRHGGAGALYVYLRKENRRV